MRDIRFSVFLLFATIFILSGCSSPAQPTDPNAKAMVLYVGEGCPHCENVEKYIEENRISYRIKFEVKEVRNNQANLKEFGEKAKSCGLDVNKIGIPLFYTGDKCLQGDIDIIEFLKQKING